MTPEHNDDADRQTKHFMTTDKNTRLEAHERRAQLLETARGVFGEYGFSATSMNDIAIAAGVTKPVLYQHFASKHDLFHELLVETTEDLATRMRDAIISSTSPRDQVEQGVQVYVSFFAENPYRFRVMFGEGVRSDRVFSERLQRIQGSFLEFAAAQFETTTALDQAHRLSVAHAIGGALENSVGQWIHSEQQLTATELASTLSSVLWRGLRTDPSAS